MKEGSCSYLPFFPVVWKRAAVYNGQEVHVLNQTPIFHSFISVNVSNSAIVTMPNAGQKLNYFCVSPLPGFRGSLVGKGSACSAGDPSLIPGSGRSPGEGYPFHFVASLLTQMVESACNVGDLCSTPDWEDSLEKEMATHSSILAWKIP